MGKTTEFEIGDYPPPTYISPTATYAPQQSSPLGGYSNPSIPSLYPAPCQLQPACRPPLHRTNASDNIHIIHTDSWYSKQWRRNKDLVAIWLANTPFLAVFVMDLVGFAMPKSAYYRVVIYNSSLWSCLQMMICLVTGAVINTAWFFSPLFGNRERRERNLDSLNFSRGVWHFIYRVLMVLVCCVGVWSWPFISARIREDVEPTYPSCAERGFDSSVLLSVTPETKGALWQGSWGVGNVTLESGDDVFGLSLSPVRDLGRFLLTADENVTSRELLPRVRGTAVVLDLDAGSYELRRGEVSGGGGRNGTFTDRKKFYLSFPSMGVRSVAGIDWSHIDKRPNVMLVDDKRVVLVGVEKHPKDRQDVMFRMCTPWSVQEMVRDEGVMEKVLVPLARVGIEMAIWAGEH